jgi:hypothetical protein
MEEWEKARDWELLEQISRLEDSSYDLVARDVWFENGSKADLVLYRQGSYEFKIVGFYEEKEDRNIEGEELVHSLRSIGDLLRSEGYDRYNIFTKRTDNVKGFLDSELEGEYRFSNDSNVEETVMEIEEVIAPSLESYDVLKCNN